MFASIISGPEMIVVGLLALVLFGSKKIPEFAKGLGQGIREFKKASREVTDEIQSSINEPAPAPRPPANTQATSATPPSTATKA
jgi:sec-independent protein translocase protein TatA